MGELEKAVETLAFGSCSHSISRSPKLPLEGKNSKRSIGQQRHLGIFMFFFFSALRFLNDGVFIVYFKQSVNRFFLLLLCLRACVFLTWENEKKNSIGQYRSIDFSWSLRHSYFLAVSFVGIISGLVPKSFRTRKAVAKSQTL